MILALDLYFRVNPPSTNDKHPEIQKLSHLLNQSPIHKDRPLNANFRNPTAVYMKLCNVLRFDREHGNKALGAGSKLDQVIWDEFAGDLARLHFTAAAINSLLAQSGEEPSIDIAEDEEALEGRVLLRAHFARERDPKIVKTKKQRALKQTGALLCEVCGFDFFAYYGEIGLGYMECHHRVPLSQLGTDTHTRLEDLALVCANCHRMLHAKGRVRTVEELRTMVLHRRRWAQVTGEVAATTDEP